MLVKLVVSSLVMYFYDEMLECIEFVLSNFVVVDYVLNVYVYKV